MIGCSQSEKQFIEDGCRVGIRCDGRGNFGFFCILQTFIIYL
jgi:hypothetical protein